jgi:translation initiation factor 1
LDELLQSADRVEKGLPLTEELDQALYHGGSVGGARPKALIEDNGTKYIAKFSSSTDLYNMDNSKLVYSTETGKICRSCQKTVLKCSCKMKKTEAQSNIKYDGFIRVQREVKGRKGKTVTTVSGFQITADELKLLAAQLKRRCGTGGSVKDGLIIIQGDHRSTLIAELKNRGFKAKAAGG